MNFPALNSPAFENSAPVQSVDFAYPEAADERDIARAQREAVIRILQRLTDELYRLAK